MFVRLLPRNDCNEAIYHFTLSGRKGHTSDGIHKSTPYDKDVGSCDNFSQTPAQRHQVSRTVVVDGYSNTMLDVVFQIYESVETG
jgi:hypothetical protein